MLGSAKAAPRCRRAHGVGRDSPRSLGAEMIPLRPPERDQAGIAISPARHARRKRGNVVSLTGKCFCGTVEIEITGSPETMGYCHCRSCRSWSGSPVNAFGLWKAEAVKIAKGAEHLAMFQKSKLSQRQYCGKCGGHLMTNRRPLGLTEVFAATIPDLAFTPSLHINYTEAVLPMRDGLPKFRNFPGALGGSGEMMLD